MAALASLRLVKRPAAGPCSCVEITGEVTCGACGGVHIISTRRRELLRDAVVEAARHLVASLLVEEREMLREPGGPAYGARVVDAADALQTLRDACAAERAARGDAR